MKAYRHIYGISINGREYLLNDDGSEMEFKTEDDVRRHLHLDNLEENGIFLDREKPLTKIPDKSGYELKDDCKLSFRQKTDLGMHVLKIRRQLIRFLVDLQSVADSHAESCSLDNVKFLSSSVRAILNSFDDIDFTELGVR